MTFFGFGSFRPKLNIYRVTENNEYIKVYQTEAPTSISTENTDQVFKTFTISSQQLNNCDKDRLIKIELVHCNTQDEDIVQDYLTLTINDLNESKLKYKFKNNQESKLIFKHFKN